MHHPITLTSRQMILVQLIAARWGCSPESVVEEAINAYEKMTNAIYEAKESSSEG